MAVVCVCVACSDEFTAVRSDAKRCAECRKVAARSRASLQYEARKDDPEFIASRKAAQRRYFDRVQVDPETRARRLTLTADWRSRNAEQTAAYGRQYRAENATQVTEKNRRRRARLLAAWDEDVDIEALWLRDEGVCGICSEPIDRSLPWPNKGSLTVDHIVPLARGGRHSTANTQIAHAVCNSRKNDR